MSELQPFVYDGNQVRTVLIDDEPWFVAKDVCDVLEIGNSRMAVSRLEEDCVSTTDVTDALGRARETSIVSEPGLYDLVFLSRKPEARSFRKWVTGTVLPQLRKTGSYSVKQLTRSDLARMVLESEAQLEQANQKITRLLPMAESYRKFLDADGTLKMGAVAQILGVGRQTLFDWLRMCRVLQSDRRPYATHQHWFTVKATSFERNSGASGVSYTVQLKPEGLEPMRELLVRRGYLTESLEDAA